MKPLHNQMIISVSVISDLCRMVNTSSLYPINSSLPCLNAPILSYAVFNQSQIATQALTALYGFTDESITPPTGFPKVNVTGTLFNIGDNYSAMFAALKNNPDNISAFPYFSNVSALFLSLYDANTVFHKPKFFSNFKLVFPFQFTNKNGFFYTEYFPENNSELQNITNAYEDLHGQLNLNSTDSILHINGMDPLQYFTYFANRYDYVGKSDYARVNGELGGAFYTKPLDVYNVPTENDTQLMIKFLSGYSLNVYFTVQCDKVIENSSVANSMFQQEINMTSPYTNVSKVSEKVKKQARITKQMPGTNSGFTQLLVSPNFYTLYQYKNDYVLSLESFEGQDNYTDTLQDLNALINKLNTLITPQTNLFISVLGTQGGIPSLAALLAYGLFPTEYPIYGRFNFMKTDIVQDLMQESSEFEAMHRVNWVNGQMISNLINSTNNTWFTGLTTDGIYTRFFAFDDDQEKGVYNITKLIYQNHNLALTPNRTILLTDGNCVHACAQFAKHVAQMNNVYSIGYGGAYNASDAFDVASSIGGTISNLENYVRAVQQIALEDYPNMNETQVENVTNIWFPHQGSLQFTHNVIYSFNSTEGPGITMEYRAVPVQTIINQFASAFGWTSVSGLQTVIPLAYQALENASWYGTQCAPQYTASPNVTYRYIVENGTQMCVPFGCSYGFYRVGTENDTFVCEKRTDQYLFPDPMDGGARLALNGGEIAGITVCIAVLAAICFGVIAAVNPKFYRCGKAREEKTVAEEI